MRHQVSEVGSDAKNYIRKNINIMKDLPEPGYQWEVRDTDFQGNESVLGKLKNMGIIERKGVSGGKASRVVWETREGAYEYVEEVVNGRSERMPCGCLTISFMNPRGSDDDKVECKSCGKMVNTSDLPL